MEAPPPISPSQLKEFLSRIDYERVLSLSVVHECVVTFGNGEELVWPSSLELSPALNPEEMQQLKMARVAAIVHLTQHMVLHHAREVMKVGKIGSTLWRPMAQRGWDGSIRIKVEQRASLTGGGGRCLSVRAGSCLLYEHEFETDLELDGEVERWSMTCEKNGWKLQSNLGFEEEWRKFSSPGTKVIEILRQNGLLLPSSHTKPHNANPESTDELQAE